VHASPGAIHHAVLFSEHTSRSTYSSGRQSSINLALAIRCYLHLKSFCIQMQHQNSGCRVGGLWPEKDCSSNLKGEGQHGQHKEDWNHYL
jgi:hypothetical protein